MDAHELSRNRSSDIKELSLREGTMATCGNPNLHYRVVFKKAHYEKKA